jgi:hypothetical protein
MIYRIEKNNIGPYNYNFIFKNENYSISLWAEDGHKNRTMPLPSDDLILGKIYPFIQKTSDKFFNDLVFAFCSKNKFSKYFTENELKKLNDLGFSINDYKEDYFFKVLYGESQCICFKSEESYLYYLEIMTDAVRQGFTPF